MNRLSRAIAGLAVLSVAAVSVVSVSNAAPAAGKSAHAVIPEYVQGYWPDDPQLCIGDITDGLPVAEAVAQFEPTNVDMVMSGTCEDDAMQVAVFVVDELLCDGTTGHDGCHFWGEDSFQDQDDLWVYASGPVVLLNADSNLTDDQWIPVIVHELGHLVGLDHTSRMDSIMRPNSTGTASDGHGHDRLTATDIAVIDQLYP